MPLAGIAFLWFVGVVRDGLGDYEDRFFSTVFFGSSLLFLAMVFVSMAIAGAILAFAEMASSRRLTSVWCILRARHDAADQQRLCPAHGGVFMISLATIWLRTGLLPRGWHCSPT